MELNKKNNFKAARATMHLKSRAANLSLIRKVVGACVCNLAFNKNEKEELKLAVTEACTNIIRHAYKNDENRNYNINMEGSTEGFSVKLTYYDPNFDPERIPKRDLNEIREGGYGVYLMQSLMDRVNYVKDSGTGDVCLYMEKHL